MGLNAAAITEQFSTAELNQGNHTGTFCCVIESKAGKKQMNQEVVEADSVVAFEIGREHTFLHILFVPTEAPERLDLAGTAVSALQISAKSSNNPNRS